ncbi:kinase-like domain-containing protein [Lasiosphaeris hirsuta]|uniref:Kinase-like domain-containing protein n=1 Tax=Lasiosphaeris hirsuta TaxID=260670 RepID=A0AA40B1L4_9PEZI|nr:kinase-like domain-containing protein [Lasiosphaeris hirsuta]
MSSDQPVSALDTADPGVTPSHPAYGVSLSPEVIRDIVSSGWPGSTVESIKPLGAGTSFNNKIYFLKMHHADERVAFGWKDAVLKVNGTIYDGDKVQNEVACLRLLEMYCPDLPIPRVLAWSETGASATFVSSTHAETKVLGETLPPDTAKRTEGWILTSRVPGSPVAPAELDAAALASLATQTADIVATWRQAIPPQPHCGSIQIRSGPTTNGITLTKPLGPGIPALAIQGLLVEELKLASPITNLHEYYTLKLQNKLNLLSTAPAYASNRHLLDPLREFLTVLPTLSFATLPSTFCFTHYDLYPRNILVSGTQITGIVDWEFSGFFPAVDEFLDDWVDGDWPEEFYTTFLGRLEEQGVPTPRGSVDGDGWSTAYWVEKIVESAAPWWLPGDLDAEMVERGLRNAEGVVKQGLTRFGVVVLP